MFSSAGQGSPFWRVRPKVYRLRMSLAISCKNNLAGAKKKKKEGSNRVLKEY
jgi:hypothetical protein